MVRPDLEARGYRVFEVSAVTREGLKELTYALADAVDATGEAVAVPIYCSSLRGAPDDLLAELGTLDALVVTVLAVGGTKPATSSAPTPGSAKICSTMIAPPSSRPNSNPMAVTTGIIALRRTCLTTTFFPSSPLAQAVRTWSS